MINIHSSPNEHSHSHNTHEAGWEGDRLGQMKSGIRESGQALKGALIDTPMHLADSVAHAGKSVVSVALATRDAVSGVFNLAAAPAGAIYDFGARIRAGYDKNIGHHTVRGIHHRDNHSGKGDELVMAG